MASGKYPLTGIQDGLEPPRGDQPRKVPLRLEVDEFWMSEDPVHVRQKSLFIRALLHIQDVLPTAPEGRTSFYQIAGIHGRPYVPWDGVSKSGSYCKHGETLFATWHRPYGLLMEQALFEVMRDVLIKEYPEKDQPALLEAAQQWRFPFWDWAQKKNSAGDEEKDYNIPRLIRLHEVQVLTPTGWEWVRNPFHSYRIPNKLTFGSEKLKAWILSSSSRPTMYSSCGATSRHPLTISQLSQQWTKGSQNNDAIMYEIRDHKWQDPDNLTDDGSLINGGNLTNGLKEQVYSILTLNNYTSFASTKKAEEEPIRWTLSLEGIHNAMHGHIGGRAQMTLEDDHNRDPSDKNRRKFFAPGFMNDSAVAAFDPIFWLHHCNVDRILALWQALHPKENREWFQKDTEATHDLLPFSQRGGKPHNSQSIESCNKLGYAYPELQPWLPENLTNGKFDPNKYQRNVTTRVNKLYASAQNAAEFALRTESVAEPSSLTIAALADQPERGSTDVPKVREILAAQVSAASREEPSVYENGQFTFNDYIVSAKFKRFGLGGEPFRIHFFVGPVPQPPYNFSGQTTQVGMVYNFTSLLDDGADQPGCDNCAQQAEGDHELADAKILTNALITRHKQKIRHSDDADDYLHSMEPEDVAAFLKKHLDWRVTTLDGREVSKARNSNGERIDRRFDGIDLKVAVGYGRVTHYQDPAKLSEYGDYEILYEVTADSESGSGAKPEDGLFTNGAYQSAA